MTNEVLTTAQLFARLANEEVELVDGRVAYDGNRSCNCIIIHVENTATELTYLVLVETEFINEPRWQLA
jgi:hypothetical protein